MSEVTLFTQKKEVKLYIERKKVITSCLLFGGLFLIGRGMTAGTSGRDDKEARGEERGGRRAGKLKREEGTRLQNFNHIIHVGCTRGRGSRAGLRVGRVY